LQIKKLLTFLGLVFIVAVLSLLYVKCISDRTGTSAEAYPTPEKAALAGMEELPELVTPDTAKSLGFDSVADAAVAQVDTTIPLVVRIVDLRDLAKFQPKTDDAEKLLRDTNIVMFPIKVRGVVKSCLTVTRQEQTWVPTAWGDSNLIQRLMENKKSSTSIVVWIPGLNLYFIGYTEAGRFMLTPVSHVQTQFFTGKSYPAQEIFTQLREKAKTRKSNEPG